jgi:Family of unknown function (DUF6090)
MAEQEVSKHTKKVYKIWHSNEHSLLHKIKEFVIEIIIIVFAVSLSIWLHDWSEHRHQQKEVKEFLLGLKEDLNNDIIEMNQDKLSYKRCASAYHYIFSLKFKEVIHKDSLEKYRNFFFNLTGLVPNNGRFEGFKSSGKIGNIENKTLQNDIMDLYQENIASLINTTNFVSSAKQELISFVHKSRIRTSDSTTNIMQVFKSETFYNAANTLKNMEGVLERYDTCIFKMKRIVKTIDKQYK